MPDRTDFIRAWRKHRGVTMETLANRIGVSVSFLSRIEMGNSPYNADVLEQIGEALNCTPADLLMKDPTRAVIPFPVIEGGKRPDRP